MITLQDLITETLNIFESEDIKQLEKERMRLYMKVKNWKKSGKDTSELEKQLNDAKKRLSDAKKAARSASKEAVVTPQQTIPSGDDSLFGDLDTTGFGSLDIDSMMNNKEMDEKIERDNIINFLEENYGIKPEYADKIVKIVKKKNTYIVNAIKDSTIQAINKPMTSLTNGIFEWGNVKIFYVSKCHNLTSLKGAPKKCERFIVRECNKLTNLTGLQNVLYEIDCSLCDGLTSLEGLPKICRKINCSYCKNLKNLKGAPETCEGIYCKNCPNLTSLEGAPRKCEYFDCSGCESLTSLKYGPEISKSFQCYSCNISSLEYAPKSCIWLSASETPIKNLKGLPDDLNTLYVANCPNLTSLKDCPSEVRRLVCDKCSKLKSLEGVPEDASISAKNTPVDI